MALFKLTNIFQLTTVASVPFAATSRTGGWSESFWVNSTPDVFNPLWATQQQKRALMLPKQASIVGFRQQNYTINGNKLLPGGASSGRQLLPGNPAFDCDVPQMTLEIFGSTAATPNVGKLKVAGIPDQFVVTGEFAPTPIFGSYLTQFYNALRGVGAGFVGRDLEQEDVRVNAYAANVVTVDHVPVGVVAGQYVRFRRVYDVNGNPVKGSFLVTNVVGNQITIQNGPAQTVTKPSGTLRLDLLGFLSFASFQIGAIIERKVGKPIRGYRGKRSKSRV